MNFASLKVAGNIAVEPTSCPGLACLKKSEDCDTCLLSEDFIDKLVRLASMIHVAPVFQSWQDARHDLYSSAPMARGTRAFMELRAFGRMKF